jgi:hypothetical protein
MTDDDVPFQSHSDTSIEAAEKVDPRRARGQERWVYEALRRGPKADWQLYDLVQLDRPGLFEQHTSCDRARIQLKWICGPQIVTPWHPVEDSGFDIINPKYNSRTTIWRIKEAYRNVPYDDWVAKYKHLIPKVKKRKKEKEINIEDLYLPLIDELGK